MHWVPTNKTANFRSVFVKSQKFMSKSWQFQTAISDVEDIGEDIDVVDAIWINSQNSFKLNSSLAKILPRDYP